MYNLFCATTLAHLFVRHLLRGSHSNISQFAWKDNSERKYESLGMSLYTLFLHPQSCTLIYRHTHLKTLKYHSQNMLRHRSEWAWGWDISKQTRIRQSFWPGLISGITRQQPLSPWHDTPTNTHTHTTSYGRLQFKVVLCVDREYNTNEASLFTKPR